MCYDYEKNALSKVAASVGVSPSDAFAYGNKLYVVGSGSNMIYVIDKKSQRTLASISTTQEMGEQEGADPRQIVAYGNNVFVTTGGGYVAVLDTTSFNISRTYKVGSRPEGMSVGMNASEQLLLYVANSDDGGGNPSISKINLATGSIDDLHFETLHNPRQLAVAGSDIYVLDWGYIDEDGTRKESGIYWLSDGSSRILTSDAVDMDAAGYSIVSCSRGHPAAVCPSSASRISIMVHITPMYGVLRTPIPRPFPSILIRETSGWASVPSTVSPMAM